ncbi:MAG TPA: CHASE3 domain-containing protein [Polyangiaceae bacterium]|nr:CHASE3 domain-containing protein [Polyangiaceae bacterium]
MSHLLNGKRFGWAILSVLLTAVAVLSYVTGTRYVAAQQAIEHTLAVEAAIDGTLSLLKDAETGQRGYILADDSQFLEPLDSARREIPPLFAKLTAVTEGDPVQSERLKKLKQLSNDKLAFIDQTIEARREDGLTRALLLIRSGRGKQLMDELRAECRLMRADEQRRLEQRKSEARAAQRAAVWGISLGSLMTIALALISLATVGKDVKELKQTAEELAQSEAYYRLLTEQGSDLVRLLSLQGKVTYVSPSVERLLGYGVEDFRNLPGMSLMHPDELDVARGILRDVSSGTVNGGVSTYRLRNKSGEFRWFEVRWGVIRDAEGKPKEIHTAGRDVTERREAESKLNAYAEQLRSLSLRDELTGLYNRRGFLEVAAQAHGLAQREARSAALVFVDLNGMKRINDELGHDVGDDALVDAAHVLRAALREADVVARLGGDEFVAFVLDFGSLNIDPLRARLRKLLDERVAELGRPYRLSMSVGAAYLKAGAERTVSQLLDEADAAMYEQKNARRAAGGVSMPPPAG